MAADPPSEAILEGKRSVKRARVLLAARLRTAAGEVDARLRDLSRKGALLELSTPLEKGESVVFVRGATIVPARVAWASGRRAGLEFEAMIDESEVLIHIGRRAVPLRQERFRRPRILSEDMNEQDRQLAKVWAKSVGMAAPHE